MISQQKSVDLWMTISIENRKITTPIYAKPMVLHLYISPDSCRPPGVLTGLVMGTAMIFYQLCSRPKDIENKLQEFFGQLLDCGYQETTLVPLFERAITNDQRYISYSPEYRAYLTRKKKKPKDAGSSFTYPITPKFTCI